MGRVKKKRVAKRRKHMFTRISIRKKMGKPIFFTLTHCNKKMNGISNKYNYKANMHKLCFVDARFYNVKYQASIITNCNYRNANIIGVDFFNCNMRGTSFKNTRFKNVVFFNCNLKDVDFTGTKFKNVTFICTNLQKSKNLDVDNSGITILRTYRPILIDESVENKLLAMAQNDSIFNAKVLHVSKNKLNQWTLGLVYERYGVDGITMLSKIIGKKKKWYNMYTVFSYMLLIQHFTAFQPLSHRPRPIDGR